VLFKRKVPKETSTIEIDTSYSGVIVLDGAEMFVEPKVSALILDMIKEVDVLSEKVDVYENYIMGKADA
jgi:hypothetical protein